MTQVVKNLPTDARDVSDVGSVNRSGRSPGGRPGNRLQDSCLENPLDRGAWRATVHRVTKSQTWLKRLSMHTWVNDWMRRTQASHMKPEICLSLVFTVSWSQYSRTGFGICPNADSLFCLLYLFLCSLFVLAVLGFHCGAPASRRSGFSSWGTWVPDCVGSAAAVCRLSCSAASGILVPWPGIKSASPCIERQILIPWTTREPPPTMWSYSVGL